MWQRLTSTLSSFVHVFQVVLATAFLAGGLLQVSVSPVQAQIQDWTNTNAPDTCVKTVDLSEDGQTKTAEVATLQGFGCLARNILAVATTFIGLAAFVMFLTGAFLYLTAGRESKHVETARQTFTYAIIGIVVALMAYFLLNIIARFTGVPAILRFDIWLE